MCYQSGHTQRLTLAFRFRFDFFLSFFLSPMANVRAEFAQSAPAAASRPTPRSTAGPVFLPPSKPSSPAGRAVRGPRSAAATHRVPPLSKNGGGTPTSTAVVAVPAATLPSRPSMITAQQRQTMQVSAFGFSAHQHHQQQQQQGDSSSTAATATAKQRQRQAAVARSRHTSCPDDGEVVVLIPEKTSDRFRLCVEALAEGCVQSYNRLFYLSHRDPVCVDALSQRYFTIPPDQLEWVQQHLSVIEVLRRQSEFAEVLDRCFALSDYFEAEGDGAEAAWHLERAVACAAESLAHAHELAALGSYGEFLERQGSPLRAAEVYEAMRSLAIASGEGARVHEACVALVRVFRRLGDELSAQLEAAGGGGAGNSGSAADATAAAQQQQAALARRYYERSVRYARDSASAVAEGEGLDALGKMHERSKQLNRALHYQQSFRFVSRRDQLPDRECDATLNMAGIEGRMGRAAAAEASLREALALAKQLGDAAKVCRATMQLGEGYRSAGDSEAATTCFREAFPAAMASGVQDLIDSVRVAMGFAAGEFYLSHAGGGKGYLPIVCNDVRTQLAWMSNGEL